MTPERLRELFVIKADGSLLWIRPSKHHPDLRGQTAGTPTPNRNGKVYWLVQVDGKKRKRSQIVFCMTRGRWPAQQIDHINGDSTDDRPSNLREATQEQNAWNHKRRAKKSPLPMGVRTSGSGRFVARIAVHKKQITIGTFNTIEQASAAYAAARVQHFGEFA